MKRSTLMTLLVLAVLTSGCATKKYVRQEVGAVNTRVDDVQGQVEENQSGIRTNREDMDAQGEELRGEIGEVSKTAREALIRAEEAGRLAEGKLLYEVAMSDDKVRFTSSRADLSDEAKAILDELVGRLKADNQDVYIEIQGHTDATGSEDYNMTLGEERAQAVRRYLSTAGVPLHRMSVISYGEAEPVADNKTREGRAANRRVVLVVLQ